MRSWTLLFVVTGHLCSGCPKAPQPLRVKRTHVSKRPDSAKTERARLRSFIERHVARLAPLSKQLNLAYWRAVSTGEQAAFEQVAHLEIRIRELHSDPKDLAFLRRVRDGGRVTDRLLARQLAIMLRHFEENQIAHRLRAEMVRLQSRLERKVREFQPRLDGRRRAAAEIYGMFKLEIDSARRRRAWDAYLARGAVLRRELLRLVELRNRIARSRGYPDFYHMRLRMAELDPEWLRGLFDDLAARTDAPFASLMQALSAGLAERFGIDAERIAPWHLEDPFFQQAPSVGWLNPGALWIGRDPVGVVRDSLRQLGLDPVAILARSKLNRRPGGRPRAVCVDVDRAGDVRILANLDRGGGDVAALLRATGHALYRARIDRQLPWLLRTTAHAFIAEAVADLLERQILRPAFASGSIELSEKRLTRRRAELSEAVRRSSLVFLRFGLLMVHFERELYRDPKQDLNRLWWRLKARYQRLRVPAGRNEPDWAAQVHLITAPASYHNYVLGAILASQLQHRVNSKRSAPTDGGPKRGLAGEQLGRFLTDRLFSVGASLRWDALLRRATGESLNPAYFAAQLDPRGSS